MVLRTYPLSIVLMACSILCSAQTSYQGMQPGSSKRDEVNKAFGSPVSEISETLSEYKPVSGPGKIYVQFEKSSGIVQRIEVLLAESMSRSKLLESLKLPSVASSIKTNNREKLEEYFALQCIVLTHESSEQSSEINRIGYYSNELFAVASGLDIKNQLSPKTAKETPGPTPKVEPPVQRDKPTAPPMKPSEPPVSKSSHNLSISNLKTVDRGDVFEFVFQFFDSAGDVDLQKARVIVPVQITCEGNAGIQLSWTAKSIDMQDSQNGTVHVEIYKRLFPSGQGKSCAISLTLKDQSGKTSNPLNSTIHF